MAPNHRSPAHRIAGSAFLAFLAWAAAGVPAQAETFSQKDMQILAKALGFLTPAPSGEAAVAIAFDPADPATRTSAEQIAGFFGDGLKAGGAILKPKLIEVGKLSQGGFLAVVAAQGVKVDQIFAASKALRVACVTADATAVESGQCVMSVRSAPKVEILISRSAASGAGVGFGSAFLLMAHEI